MRTSVTSLSKKFISTFFAATLVVGLIPAAAFADNGEEADNVIPNEELQDESVGNALASSNGEDLIEDNASTGEDSNLSIPAATQRINQDMTLQTRTVAQAESTRSYFLAQTLESTRTVPIVSANLPLDTSSVDVVEPDAEGEGSAFQDEEGDDGEDDPESEDPVGARIELAPYENDSAVSAESTVIGSFTYRGITYAVEPGGESVAVVAADYSKLPDEFIEAQTIVLPSMVTADGINYYSVTRIADNAFSTVKPQENEEGITAITIPASVTEIGDDAFTGFDTLQYIIVSDDNPNYSQYDGCLYDADQTRLLLIPEGRLGAVRIAPSVTEIDPEVFSHCPSVDTLVADADSAAYQLLLESDYYITNGSRPILMTGDEAIRSGSVFFQEEDIVIPKFDVEIAQNIRNARMELRGRYAAATKGSDQLAQMDTLMTLIEDGFTLCDFRDTSNIAAQVIGSEEPTAKLAFGVYSPDDYYGTGYVPSTDRGPAPPGTPAYEFVGDDSVAYGDYRLTGLAGAPSMISTAGTFFYSSAHGFYMMKSSPTYARQPIMKNGSTKLIVNSQMAVYKENGSSLTQTEGYRTLIVFPPPYTTLVKYKGEWKDGDLSVSGAWVPREGASTVTSEVFDTGVLEASDIKINIADPEIDDPNNPGVRIDNEYYWMPIPQNIQPSGYAFVGWNTASNGTGDWYYRVGGAPTKRTLSASTTLYAIYTKSSVVTLDDMGGSGGSGSFFAHDLLAPVKDSVEIPNRRVGTFAYAFNGYYESVGDGLRNYWYDREGSLIGSSAGGYSEKKYDYPLVSNVTLYADWVSDITLDTQGGKIPAADQKVHVTWNGDMPTTAVAGADACSPDDGPVNHGAAVIAKPERDGYEFNGYWSTPYDESDASKQYYELKGGAVVPVADKVWDIDQDRLYAHWKYKIKFFDNAYDSEGNKVAASVDLSASSISQSGEGFAVVTEGEGTPFIDARYGAPIPLPKATRTGYGETRAWGLTSGTNGKAGWVVMATDDFYTAKAKDGALAKASPMEATYVKNGASTDSYSVAPGLEDHTLILHASWLWDKTTPDTDKVVPGGGKNRYNVRLKASYAEGGFTYAAKWPEGTVVDDKGDVVLTDVEYDAVIETSVGAPSFVSVTGPKPYELLAFKGFYTKGNVPEPPDGIQGIQLIEATETGLAGTTPLLVVPESGNEITLYALWTLPVTNVVFHLNKSGLESTVAYSAVKDDANVLAIKNGSVYRVSIETNEQIPEIAKDIVKPSNDNYVFNGWWTHPYLEDRPKDGKAAKSTQCYDADNHPIDKDGKILTWAPYGDTVLYAHWKYNIELDPSDGLLKKGLTTPEGNDYYDQYGNRYDFTDDDPSKGLGNIYAILGAPVYLPEATKEGYDPTTDWGAGPTDDDGRTVTKDEPVKPAKPSIGKPGFEGNKVVLTPNFEGKAKTYTVKLAAAYPAVEGEAAFSVADPGTTEIENVKYDKALNSVASAIDAPWRDGYTFMGYSTAKNADSASPSGILYIDGVVGKTSADTASVKNVLWKEAPSGSDEVTLYAAWKKDAYAVEFAPAALKGDGADETLTPGTEEVRASSIQGRTWEYGERMSDSQFPVASKLQESPSPFFRNGYDFKGWYYIAEDGKTPVKVSAGTGTPGESEYGRDVAWTPSKAWQVAHRNDASASVVLYAAWTPKVYELRFDLDRPGETDAAIPSATYPGAGNRNNVKQASDGTYYYEVKYGEKFSPYFGEEGDAATVPEFDPYAFTGWTHDDEHLFAEDAAEASGVFAPSYDIARWSEDVNVIVYTGNWKAPGAKTVTFHAGSHGSFADDASEIVIEGFEYSPTPVEIDIDMHPDPHDGYAFWGYVAGPANGERPTDLYVDGKPNQSYERVLALSKVKEDVHLWAVYTKEAMSITLKLPQGAVAYESADASAKRAWTTKPFDVEDDPFTLPGDVRQPGKRFVGWKLEGTNDTPSKTVTIAPSQIAGSSNTNRSYVPVMEDRIYRVSFDPDYRTAASTSAGEVCYVYLTYDGVVADPGTLDGAVKGRTLSAMPSAPEPKAQKDAASGTWRSYPFTSWWVGTSTSLPTPPVKKGAGEAVMIEEWHAFFDKAVFTKAIVDADMTEADKKAKATDALNVYAAWDPSVSAVCPLYVPLALDSQTGDVAIPDLDFSIRSANGTALKVAALRYDRIDAVTANGSKTSPFARVSNDEAPVYLNVFAGTAAEELDMGRASIENGIVSGEYGTNGNRADLVRIDLSAPSAIYTPYEHPLFAVFDTDDAAKKVKGALRIRYGLDLNGVSTATLARIRTLMPSQNGTLQANGWTAEQVPVAQLLYTVQTAN